MLLENNDFIIISSTFNETILIGEIQLGASGEVQIFAKNTRWHRSWKFDSKYSQKGTYPSLSTLGGVKESKRNVSDPPENGNFIPENSPENTILRLVRRYRVGK